MKTLFRILFAPFIWLAQACSPLGNPVDKDISDSFYYNKSKTDVVYSPMGNWFELEATKIGADVSTFKLLNRHIAKDKERAYYQSTYINHPEFSLSEFKAKQDHLMLNIGMDHKNVYCFKRDYGTKETVVKKIAGADPATFIATDYEWAKDKNHYYHRYEAVAVDYESFKRINERFHLDKKQAYYHTYEDFKAFAVDVASFKKIDDNYAYDNSYVYFFAEYVSDRAENLLQYIPNPDSRTIRVLNKNHLKAGDKVYYQGFEIVAVDINNFETVSEHHSKDLSNVYYEGIVIPNADPASFRYDDKTHRYRDKNTTYVQGKPEK